VRLQVETFTVHKRFPLTISRGTTAQTTNVCVRVEQDGIESWGEGSPFSVGETPQTTDAIAQQLQHIAPTLEAFHPLDRQKIEQVLQEAQIPSAAHAALDLALWDWLGKKVQLPLWQLWGLNRDRIVPTSVTIGINPPEVAQQRVKDWLQLTAARALKVKLGSPDGIAADQAMLLAVHEVTPPQIKISIDANGGWSLADAIKMSQWLEQ